MIRRLYIKNFILIKELSIDFSDGFTSITGETGAGKSILVGAIGLILGARADSKSVGTYGKKSIIEAEFNADGIMGLRQLFTEYALDYDDTCILRREVLDTGKSRAFVNDTPVTVTTLRAIGERLVDIHSQHHNMLIADEAYQVSILDTIANNSALIEKYVTAYDEYKRSQNLLNSEIKRIEDQKKQKDYLLFQFNELENAKLLSGELSYLEERQAMAAHGQEISEALRAVTLLDESIDDELPSVSSQISNTSKALMRVSAHFPQADSLYQRLESVELELNDIIREATALHDSIDVDPQELEQLDLRLDQLQGLLYKHNLTEYEDLILLRDKYGEQLAEITDSDHHIQQLSKRVEANKEAALILAKEISSTRKKAAEMMTPRLHDLMNELGISGASFLVKLTDLPQLSNNGIDQVQFLFSTNKKVTLQPINQIASGGEISRFVLSLKSIIAEHRVLPTVIFDEIDTGVSGEIAERLGRVMVRLSSHIQVISITHLPQIAALAEHQLVVEKIEESEGFYTTIREVKADERISHLASMLSGAKKTQAAIDNAKELLNDKYKKR